MTFEEISEVDYQLDDEGRFYISGQEIAVIYMRNGYQEEQYQEERDWKIREIMEISIAIKCPSVRF